MTVREPHPSWDDDKKAVFVLMQVFDQLPKQVRYYLNDSDTSAPTNFMVHIWHHYNNNGLQSTLEFLRGHGRVATAYYRQQYGVTPSGMDPTTGKQVF